MKRLLFFLLIIVISLRSFAALPTVSSFSPAAAYAGVTVTITGINFTGTLAVTFGGTPASSFTVVSATQITAVVAMGTSGNVAVTNIDGTGSKTGFIYITTSKIITDFGGFWPSTALAANTIMPDSSHNLLAFTYNGITYSTGVNNAALTSNGVTFNAGNFKALPVAGITGITSGGSTYLALAKKVDGSASIANTPAVASFSVKNSLVDGKNGLDMGTGVTNLPSSAIITFQINSILPSAINDAEPDILLTQIAQPVVGNDLYSFIDASGNIVGNTFTQDMTQLPPFGTYILDLFNLTPSTPYNSATAYSAFAANTTREIRLTGIRLSDCGITLGNVSQVKALRITPSGNSDYAFIGYNANAINLPPNVSQDVTASNTTVCSGGTASMSVVASAAGGGALSYTWQESTNSGGTWTTITNGGNYSGTATAKLNVANAVAGRQYRTVVTESANPSTATSSAFTIVISAPTSPSSVIVSGSANTVCLNSPVQLTAAVTGGSNLYYQWQTNASGSYVNIADANLNTYTPPVNQTGTTSYNVMVTSGSGCGGSVMGTAFAVTVTGISSTTAAAICSSGTLTLNATATSGTVTWYAGDTTTTVLSSSNSFTTPVLNTTTNYYVSASGCSAALRVLVKATVNPATIGGNVNGGSTVVAGSNSTTLTLSNYTGNIVKWQSSTDNFIANIVDIANTTDQLTVTNLTTTTTKFKTQVKSGTCSNVFSSAATITVTGALPILVNSIKAIRENNTIRIQWTAYAENNTQSYVVEHSTDGVNFSKIYSTIPAAGNGNNTYNGIDNSPVQGYNFYRIKDILISGQATYSTTVKVLYEDSKSGISIFPNPVVDDMVTLQFNNMKKGTYDINVINNLGEVIGRTSYIHPGGFYAKTINLPANLSNGVYRVNISNTAMDKKSYAIMVSK